MVKNTNSQNIKSTNANIQLLKYPIRPAATAARPKNRHMAISREPSVVSKGPETILNKKIKEENNDPEKNIKKLAFW